jgi:hypothetical protein
VERRHERGKHVRDLAYMSPPAMIAAVTSRRLAGDWRGGCAAGLVDVHVDLRDVASRYGTDEAGRVEADLVGFAPDLLRRFVPRTDRLALAPRARIVLSRVEAPFRMSREARGWTTPVLVATLPDNERVRQRIALRVTDVNDLLPGWYDLPDWCWHADAVAARRWAYGASATRLAWHSADGRPFRQGESIAPEQPADRAGEVEILTALLDAKRPVEAYEAAGFVVDTSVKRNRYGAVALEWWLAHFGATLPVLAAETRRLAHRYGHTSIPNANRTIAVDAARDGGLTVRSATRDDEVGGPVAFAVRAPVDVTLLRWGSLRVDELHPLVHEALFPERAQTWHVPARAPRPAIRVRCGPDWHTVCVAGGRILTPHHADEEIRREFVLAGLGGPIGGCAAAVRAWRTGSKPIPKEIRRIRQDLFALAFHGDTDTVLAILADGFDSGLRDGGGGTLMHWLHHLDHRRMLPFLTAAGLSVEERDQNGRTPLHLAASSAATEVMEALVAAGADPDAVDARSWTAADVLAQVRKAASR